VAIFLTYSEILKPFAVFRYMDAEGYLHVTWTVVDDTGNGQAVYYTQLNLEENQLTWTVPTELAIAEGYEADWSSVVKHNGDLMVVYQNSSPATRWMTLSKDNGQTWSEPARPFPHVG